MKLRVITVGGKCLVNCPFNPEDKAGHIKQSLQYIGSRFCTTECKFFIERGRTHDDKQYIDCSYADDIDDFLKELKYEPAQVKIH